MLNFVAAQLLSREPRVFISRPNVRGTLVTVEKAASHSVSLSTLLRGEPDPDSSAFGRAAGFRAACVFHFAFLRTIITSII